MVAESPGLRLSVGRQAAVVEGFLHGFRYPSLIVIIASGAGTPQSAPIEVAAARLQGIFTAGAGLPARAGEVLPVDADGVVRLALALVRRWMEARGLPVYEEGRILRRLPDGAGFEAGVPAVAGAQSVAGALLRWAIALAGRDTAPLQAAEVQGMFARFNNRIAALPVYAPNTRRFIQVAFENGIAFRQVVSPVHAFGVGKRLRWMDSSFTDVTPYLGTAMAKRKAAAAVALGQAGLPVPHHFLVGSAEDALRAAREIGCPVVVKPEDSDGGQGVRVDIRNDDDLARAVAAALAYSPRILVEKHVHGRDYRLVVLHGQLVFAIERVPGGVTGDGKATIAELVREENLNPLRGDGHGAAPMRRILLDEEAEGVMTRAGLTAQSVPEAGVFVRLRSAPNVANGGSITPVTESVHPDNAALALRAAQVLGLDLAGIDLIIPSIEHSWLETGGTICEVNAQPALGQKTTAALYPLILSSMLEGRGHIPVCVVAGGPAMRPVCAVLAEGLARRGLKVAVGGPDGVFLDGKLRVPGQLGPLASGLAMASDRDAGAIVLRVEGTGVLTTGMAFASFDTLILEKPADGRPDPALATALQPACPRPAITIDPEGLTQRLAAPAERSGVWKVINGICDAMIADSARRNAGPIKPVVFR